MAIAMVMSGELFAGGILTNTNTSVAFNRNFARDGVIAIDGVYSNPAGVSFMPQGWHLSFTNQSVKQTRTIKSGITVPAFQGTPSCPCRRGLDTPGQFRHGWRWRQMHVQPRSGLL